MEKKTYLLFILVVIACLSACGTKGIAVTVTEEEAPLEISDVKTEEGQVQETDEEKEQEIRKNLKQVETEEQQEATEFQERQLKEQESESEIHMRDDKDESISEKEKNILSEAIETEPVENEVEEEKGQQEVSAKETVKAGVPVVDALLPEENSKERTEPITHVVMHFSSNVLENPHQPYELEDTRDIFIAYGVSAHYIIGRNGEIYELVPEDRVAFHAGKGELPGYPNYKDRLNDYSIGIEIMAIGTKEEMNTMMSDSFYDSINLGHIGYTDAQYKSLQLLLDDILLRNPAIEKDREHVIGHDEYAPNRKTDPGSLFDWSSIGF
ncbi:N-acetylmuramoyl-L-alanine amidase [Oceanobacillus damuensis]|uniref:N-acetylmuramoyl-L-alanine amidase n=1 Tax=Oceanobacillus damuensis TaxID=937928 RepID=UPI000AF8BDB2|nr:N-acetylmuramoyl-L-alanine amidase [Oceanobacillus damuensis]